MRKEVAWSLFASAAALAVGFAGRRLLEGGWELATGEEPPENPAAPDVTWAQALTWAAASAAVVAVSRILAQRGAAAGWQSVTGSTPPFEA